MAMHVAPAQLTGLLELGLREVAAQPVRRMRRIAALPSACRATGLALRITPLTRGNPDLAAKLYKGEFAFSGTTIKCDGRLIFEHRVPDEGWTSQLHGFAWLAHLKAGNRELWRVQARGLISDWIDKGLADYAGARTTPVLSRRLIAWMQHADFVLQGASTDFEAKFMASLTRQVRRLLRAQLCEADRRARLDGAIALAYAALGLSGLESLRVMAFDRLAAELNQQILPDGGHVSRSPAAVLDILLDLLPLRLALENGLLEVPEALNIALERMLPMLRFMCHGDGGLASFNGVSDTMAGRARAVLAADGVRGRPVSHAVHSGYCRLSGGNAMVLMDTGRPPAPGLNDAAAAGPLAFEFSDGSSRIVVNCGSSEDKEWHDPQRMTAAHSTVSLAETCAARIVNNGLTRSVFGTPVIVGPANVDAEYSSNGDGAMVQARHDGYFRRLGLLVHRRLYLAGSGGDLRGEDCFSMDLERGRVDANVPFAIRFHLHPSVKATQSQDGSSIMLMLPNKHGWRFSARGGTLSLQDSIYLSGSSSPRRSRQIVISGVAGRPDRVNWAFKRIAERKATGKPARSVPQLPL